LPNWICWVSSAIAILGFAAALWIRGGYIFPAIWRSVGFGIPALLLVSGAVLRVSTQNPRLITRFLARIGDASYAIYLLHPQLGFAIITWNLRTHNLIVNFVIAFAILVPFSLMIHVWFERPAQRLITALLDRSRYRALHAGGTVR
jgi:peptidoglycan/LPS O-acetylase OafA/YrhL